MWVFTLPPFCSKRNIQPLDGAEVWPETELDWWMCVTVLRGEMTCCNSCVQTRWANPTPNLPRQTACLSLLVVSCICYWRNCFGITGAVVGGASQVIYTFYVQNRNSIPYCTHLRESWSNFGPNPASRRGWLITRGPSEHPPGPSLINHLSGCCASVVTQQWGIFS